MDSFTVYMKTEGIYSDIAKDVETRFDTSNYELNRPLPKGKNNWINERWATWKKQQRSLPHLDQKPIVIKKKQKEQNSVS